MNEFILRNEKEKKIAAFPEFRDAWDYLVIVLENEGDLVEEVNHPAANISTS
jgi:hypothetical protein